MKNIVIDIGASSYRVMLSEFKDYKLTLKEIMRKKTLLFNDGEFLRWNIISMGDNILSAVKGIVDNEDDIESVGVCSFGVDYVYLKKDGTLLDQPIAYRDKQNETYASLVLNMLTQDEIYHEAGIQFLPFNTIFQLYRDKKLGRSGEKFLMISDYIAYLLTGETYNELTGLSTGAFIDKNTLGLSELIFKRLQLNKSIMQPIKKPGEVIGYLKSDISSKKIPVIAVNSHDTSSAVTSLNLKEDGSQAFLSCGSWALFGTKNLIFNTSFAAKNGNFTNELMDDGICFLKNINGMYLINEIYRAMRERQPDLLFPLSVKEFKEEEETEVLLDVDHPLFANPENILEKLTFYLEKTEQVEENLTIEKLLNAFYKSLCFQVRQQKEKLEELNNHKIEEIYLVGGAVDIPIYIKYLSAALNTKVKACFKEATAIGNAVTQMSSLKGVPPDEFRKNLEENGHFKVYGPDQKLKQKFEKDYDRFKKLVEEGK